MNKLVDLYYCLKQNQYPMISDADMSQSIKDALDEKKPFFAGRLGATESSMLRIIEFGYKSKEDKIFHQLCEWSGFFPENKRYLDEFVNTYKSSMRTIDMMSPFPYRGINYFIDKYMDKNVLLVEHMLSLNDGEDVWTKNLKGKKVLVIHPFQRTIEAQYYRKRSKIFKNELILPEFELNTIKAVQTIAGEKDSRFCNWFEALDYMFEEASKKDFDVALIGCGAYGFPLAAKIKSLGKVAIHVGGELQLLFGIKGSRWDVMPRICDRFYNDNWVYPDETECPPGAKGVEEACYWRPTN